VMNADGTHQKRLLLDRKGRYDDDLGATVWAPDSKRIAFERNFQIYSRHVNGSGMRKLTACEFGCASDPAWSPDGHQIAYVGINSDIYVMNADGGQPHKIVDISRPWDLGWAPAGTNRLLFTARVGYGTDVYVANADGTGLRNLTKNAIDQYSPTWSPDGRSIAFVRHKFGESRRQIYVVRATGGKPRNVSRSTTSDDSPAWSPDGTRIAFARSSEGLNPSELFIMAADGRNQRRLTSNAFDDGEPMWRPRARG
jgi:TolB protein